jgi:hypothetical protein
MLLALKVFSDVRTFDATTVEADRLGAMMFPVAVIDETKRVEGVGTGGAGKTLPLMDETVSWGVDIQFEPVMKVPLT